jgi:hypothetical protein
MFRAGAKVLRLALFCAFVGAIFACLGARAVWARAQNEALKMASGLVSMGDAAGPYYDVKINGEAMHVASSWTDKPMKEVLDRFEGHCMKNTGGMLDELDALPPQVKDRFPVLSRPGMGVLRAEGPNTGVVGCLVREGAGGRKALLGKVGKFFGTGDLHELGDLHYLAVQKDPRGHNVIVVAWTEGPFHIGTMFPAEGDAPGADPPNVERLPESRRILSAGIDKSPFVLTTYLTSTRSPDEALEFYGAAMSQSGWQRYPMVTGELALQHQKGAAFLREGVDTFVFSQQTSDGQTAVSILSMPPRANAR